jgi:outer membrane protein TolC
MIVRERLRKWIVAGCIGSTILAGCNTTNRFRAWKDSSQTSYFQSFITQVEYPDLHAPIDSGVSQSLLPLSIENPSQLPTFELSLRDAVQAALQSSDVLRSIGGSVVTAPQGQSTSYDNALSDLNPNAGVEAALAAFDAQVTSRLSWQKNDRPINFDSSGGAGNFFVPINVQTQGIFTNQIQKRTATGAQYALRLNTIYDRNNGRNRQFSSDFSGFVEAEYRQPLMQGSGTTFNRIAGPSTIPGQYNGVLIARINTDISIADFEAAVIRLINDVEGAYWELYFAYRALDAQVLGRKSSLETWQRIKERKDVGKASLEEESQTRATFYQFEALMNDALSGANGLYAVEQRLRYVMGMPPSDGRLIKPSDDPMQAEVSFDWQTSVCDALTRRVEVRRQEWTVKRRELELIASRLNRRPRLDALTQYRWRGLGDHLIEERDRDNQFNSLVQNILEGNFQEWQAGLEWQYNVGLRQASAAVRHAQLNLAREMSVLKEQQLRISHDLSNAARQIVSSYTQMQKNYNRVKADEDRITVFTNRTSFGLTDATFLNQAQLQLATSQSAFYRSLVDYNLALRDFHREKGSLLAYNQVNLAEEALNGSAIEAAFDRGRYFTPRDNPDQVVVRNTVATPQPE